MPLLNNYDIVIFDCDGVILDSNEFKIDAMHQALILCNIEPHLIEKCTEAFRQNFGKSRFFHVGFFVDKIICPSLDHQVLKDAILRNYSELCGRLYVKCEETESIRDVFASLSSLLYVASGSEQKELRNVFSEKGLSKYFGNIFGSPESKTNIVKRIVDEHINNRNIVMIGDAESDFLASCDSGIDFIFYAPLSNVKEKMLELSKLHNFKVINCWTEIL